MNKNKVNLALQVLPQSDGRHPYSIVDKAIEVIQNSGLPYKVCPFETVIEGTWDEVMALAQKVHEVCYENETTQMMTYIKIQSRKDEDVTIFDKMEKYE
ncbi:MAG: MTH1187 family thiamine-binding protein [Prolixibacteraceae bacterium]